MMSWLLLFACLPELTAPETLDNPDHDSDGDGQDEAHGDCDDADPTVYSGAPELCDAVQNDCEASDWSSEDEEQVVSWVDADDVWHDVTDEWNLGTLEIPQLVELPEAGRVALCPGSYSVRVVDGGNAIDVTLEGRDRETTWLHTYGTEVGVSLLELTNDASHLEVRHLSLLGAAQGDYGGALRLHGGSAVLEDVELSDNDAARGGAIYSDGDVTLSDCVISNNNATDYAGAIFNSGTLTITDCVISGNDAPDGGGAIYNDLGAEMTLSGVELSDNAANFGGAIYAQYGEVVLEGVTFTGNQARTEGGGGLLIGKAQVSCEDSLIEGNEAYLYGGGVHINEHEGSLSGRSCAIHDNDPAGILVLNVTYDVSGAEEFSCHGESGCTCDGSSCPSW